MKKILPYILCAAGTFMLLIVFIPRTLMLQESLALFLNTPDWLRDTFAGPWPLAHLTANWLLQFFHYMWGGPTVLALLVTAVMGLTALLFRGRGRTIYRWCFVGTVLAMGIYLLNTGKMKAREVRSTVELAVLRYDWQGILEVATPQAVKGDRDLLPYALLALTETGQLSSRMFTYPIASEDDFYPKSWYSSCQLLYGSVLYERMGSVNEAIHLATQAGDALPYGTSFGVLRRLAILYRLQGHNTLADKYLYILSHSTLHAAHPQGAHPQMRVAERPDSILQSDFHTTAPDIQHTAEASVVHDQWFFNVTAMLSEGARSATLIDRSLCAMLARRDLEHFVQMWNTLPHPADDVIPTHYREALLLANPGTKEQAKGPYTRYYQAGQKTSMQP